MKQSLHVQLEWEGLPEKFSRSAQRGPEEGNQYSPPILSPCALFCSFHFVSILLLDVALSQAEIFMLVFTELQLVFSDHFFN